MFYGAAVSEASAMTGSHVAVVGAGNSAGQAALHLAKYASRVAMLVRGDTLGRDARIVTAMSRTIVTLALLDRRL